MANGRMDDEAIVAHFMVRSPIVVEGWQPVAQARQLMLTYSISYLPWWNGDKWTLLSETSLLRYLRSARTPNERVGFPARQLQTAALDLIDAVTVAPDTKIDDLLSMLPADNASKLWLVVDSAIPERLLGVFTPFDLL
jgi:CBS-domain-containing membrane protein